MRILTLVLLGGVLLGTGACAGILGIEEAVPLSDANGSGGGDTGAGGGSDGMPKTLCEKYCDEVMANCKGDFAQYASVDVCLILCDSLEPGDEGDDDGNTVECRRTYADLADKIGEREFNCPAAGPGGDGLCGDNCDGLCTMIMDVCPDEYGDHDECLDDCGGVPDKGGYDISDASGDSVQCRLYHVGASALAPATHCGHTAGDPPC